MNKRYNEENESNKISFSDLIEPVQAIKAIFVNQKDKIVMEKRFSLRKLSIGLCSVALGYVLLNSNNNIVHADEIANSNTTNSSTQKTNSDTAKNVNSNPSVDTSKQNTATDANNTAQTANQTKTADTANSAPAVSGQADSQQNSTQTSQNTIQTNNSSTVDPVKTPKTDLDTEKDPSQINPDHFADGTHYTPAGWTRGNDQYTAKESHMTITSFDQNNEDTRTELTNRDIDFKLDFTIDRTQLKKGRGFLIATVQDILGDKQDITKGSYDYMNLTVGFNARRLVQGGNDIIIDNRKVGFIESYNRDNGESDLYFNSTVDASDMVTDIKAKFTTTNQPLSLSWANTSSVNRDFGVFTKDGFKFPMTQYIITPDQVYQNHLDFEDVHSYDTPEGAMYDSYYMDPIQGTYGKRGIYYSDQPIEYVIKLQDTDESAVITGSTIVRKEYHMFNKDNRLTDEIFNLETNLGSPNQESDNLTARDLMKLTKMDSSSYSKQKDGSYLVCVRYDPSKHVLSKDELQKAAEGSYVANIGEPNTRDEVAKNTVNYYTTNPKTVNTYNIFTYLIGDQNKPSNVFITDVTPNKAPSKTASSSHTVNGIAADAEFYRTASVQYIDDVTGKTVSFDTIMGKKNTSQDFTINIPQGFLLNDNNSDSGNYIWNKNKTGFTYNFKEDQTLNTPVEIHLKHDFSYTTKYNPARRTITIHMPDGSIKTIIQTVGYKYTVTTDLATNVSTDSTPVFDQETSNVTVNGQIDNTLPAFELKNGKYYFAAIVLPTIPGYKRTIIKASGTTGFAVLFQLIPKASDISPDNGLSELSDNKRVQILTQAQQNFARDETLFADQLNQLNQKQIADLDQVQVMTVTLPKFDHHPFKMIKFDAKQKSFSFIDLKNTRYTFNVKIKASNKIELTIINKDKSKHKFTFDSVRALNHALTDFVKGKKIKSSNALR